MVLIEPVPGTAIHVFTNSRAKTRRPDPHSMPQYNNITPNIDHTLNLGNFEATTQITHFSAQRPNVHAVLK